MSESKSYSVEVRSDDEFSDVPNCADFEINLNDAREIIRLAALVSENSLHKLELFDYRVSYSMKDLNDEWEEEAGEVGEVRTDCDCLNVSRDEFWFSAHWKNSSVAFFTQRQSINDLAEHFGLEWVSRT